jgi:hypothetical protein
VQTNARGSAIRASFKGDLVTNRHPREKVLLTFGKHFKPWRGDTLCEGLREEAVAVASDFENQIRRQLIASDVVVEELRIDMNLGVLLLRLGRLKIGKRQLRIQEMKSDVIDTGRSSRIGQYNDTGPCFEIASDE